MALKRPTLIVFDLDYTLWPFWVDSHVNPPFQKSSSGRITDSTGSKVVCYDEVPAVLDKLHKEGYTLGVASRTGEIKGAVQLIELFNWSKYFKYKEIYPGSKITHLQNIKKKSGIYSEDILFFDDENRNISDVSSIGITSILVQNGVTNDVVNNGLQKYALKHS